MNTFTGIFMKSEYQLRLSAKLSSICDECTSNFTIITKDLLFEKLYTETKDINEVEGD